MRRFVKDLGQRLPQLKVRASVLRAALLEGAPTTALWSNAFGFRKRLDGGYTIGDGSANIVTITPDSFRFFGDFLPVLRTEFSSLRLRVDGRFSAGGARRALSLSTDLRPTKRCGCSIPNPTARTCARHYAVSPNAFGHSPRRAWCRNGRGSST